MLNIDHYLDLSISEQEVYVELFDKLIKCLDSIGYKCVFNVKTNVHGIIDTFKNNLQQQWYCAFYVIQYNFIMKDSDDVKSFMPTTDVFAPDCSLLKDYLYTCRSFGRNGNDISNMLFYENYVCLDLNDMLTLFSMSKHLFCSLFLSDILEWGIAIRDIRNWLVKQVIIKPKSTAEEALIDIDMLVP